MIRSLLLLFTLWSSSFHANGALPLSAAYNQNGCHGANRSPALAWSGAPHGTKSYALVLHDDDTPGSGFYHWVLFNIPANIRKLDAGTHAGTAGTSSWNERAYGGPCPPPGKPHHYAFHLYALNIARVNASGRTDGGDLLGAITAHIIGEAKLTATYQRASVFSFRALGNSRQSS